MSPFLSTVTWSGPKPIRKPCRRRRGVLLCGVAAGTALLMALSVSGTSAAASRTSGTPPSAPAAAGNPRDYTFLARVHGAPIHWNKCRVIGYRVNVWKSPRRAVPQVREAVQRLSARSRLRYRYLGKTTVFPSLRKHYPPSTRLIVGWTVPSRSREMPPGVAGVGGPEWVTGGRYAGAIRRGFVQLNRRVHLAPGFGAGPSSGILGTIGQVLMHELGHSVGLGHARGHREIMYRAATHKVARWGAGDLTGLRQVGRARRCF
ncbi:MAG: matrixin family metalloprotease [Nocardioidaceae bacterium]